MVIRFVYIIDVTKVHINLFMVKCSMLLFLHINYIIQSYLWRAFYIEKYFKDTIDPINFSSVINFIFLDF